MKIRFLSEQDVIGLLPMGRCLEVMTETLRAIAAGQAVNPLRTMVRFPDGSGLLGLMPAYLGSPACTGLKVITYMPGNHGTPYDSHQGFVLLFEMERGRPRAVIDASSITAIRTAAVSGVATQVLAREDASRLALLGSGTQARSHLAAMREARALREVRVWSRSFVEAQAFVHREQPGCDAPLVAMATAEEAVRGADIVCTTTASSEPVLRGEWLAPGAHVNAVGACFKTARELDTPAVVRSSLFVDRRESAENEAGDYLIPLAEGAIGSDHIRAELGDVLLGRHPGRRSPDEVTLFKSLGIAVEDLGAAHDLYTRAEAQDVGVSLDIGGPDEND